MGEAQIDRVALVGEVLRPGVGDLAVDEGGGQQWVGADDVGQGERSVGRRGVGLGLALLASSLVRARG